MKSICLKCDKEYREKKMLPRNTKDGFKIDYETIPNICDKCFKKQLKLFNVLQQGLLKGKINIQEIKDYKNKKISRELLDTFLRTREDNFYDNKQDIDQIKGVLL